MKSNEILCSSCRTIKSQSEFANGYGAQAGRKVSICKECCTSKLEKYEQRVGRVGAFWLLMAELGIPFIQQVYDAAYHASISIKKGAKRPDLVELYVKKLNLLDMKYDGFWDSDTMLDDILNEHKETLDPKLDLALMNRIWGKYPDDKYAEAYDFLEDRFNDYTKDILDMDANLTNRYRDLCKAEYQKRVADESGDIGEIQKAQKVVNDMLTLLKLNNFQDVAKSDAQIAFEKAIAMIEYTKPAECEELDKYVDMCGHERDNAEMMRCLRNAIAGTRDYPEIPRDER